MEQIKKNRKASRSVFTKNSNDLEQLINDDGDITEIKAQYDLLSGKSDTLKILDEQVYTLLLEDDKITEEDLVKELESREHYRRRYVVLQIKFNEYLAKKEHKNENMEQISSTSSLRQEGKRNFKLPVIQFKTFDGNIKDWLPFWAQFSKVHDDQNIDLNDKVEYLLQATVPNSKARQLVESFPTIGKNYHEIIDCLKARFGREDLQIEIYVRELLKLIMNNAISTCKIDLSLLYDGISTQLRALETLGVTSEGCASMLLPLIESCLPEDLLRVWQRSPLAALNNDSEKASVAGILQGSDQGKAELASEVASSSETRLNNLMLFLKGEVEGEQRITLATEGFGLGGISSRDFGMVGRQSGTTHGHTVPTAAGLVNYEAKPNTVAKCVFCDKPHNSASCFKAQTYSLEKRKEILTSKRACFRCLKVGHQARKCKARLKCLICSKPHLAVMCPGPGISKHVKEESSNPSSSNNESSAVLFSCTNGTSSHVFLQTLRVQISGINGSRWVRALIDTGSQNTYILNTTAQLLNYTSKRKNKIMHCLFGGAKSEMVHECYDVKLNYGQYSCVIEALSQPMICTDVSPVFYGPWIEELKGFNINLCDQGDPAPIEILIGADVAGKLYTGQKRILSNGLVAIETLLGWTLMGRIPLHKAMNTCMTAISLFLNDASLTQLWQLDTLGIRDSVETKSRDQLTVAAKEFFLETVSLDSENRYEIRLPWIEGHAPIPTNHDIAMKRLQSTLKRLENLKLYNSYDAIFQEWEQEGIIEKVPNNQRGNTDVHYLPHRPVLKENSTTRIRPVFDASAKEKNSPSLNCCLEKGPNLIEQIPDILIRFRQNKIGVIADIRKAFLQISIHPNDREFLRFLWTDPKGHEVVYRHRRVVFGVSSSPFLLAATLDYHMSKVLEKCDKGASLYDKNILSILSRSFYVDNCVTSVPNEEILEAFIRESSMILAEAKFDLRGWEHSGGDQPSNDVSKLTAVLGLTWDTCNDSLSINEACLGKVNAHLEQPVTKRVILSLAQKIFDPVGFTCPATLVPKLLLQKVWEKKLTWDAEVDEETEILFKTWLEDLHFLLDIKITRWTFAGSGEAQDMQLHVFCDASKSAYATVIFLRCVRLGEAHVSLVAAKSRVAPLKVATIPRLELLAAVIGTRLAKAVQKGLGVDIKSTYWTDSSTVLAWIRRNESWNTFVHNRVQEIRDGTSTNEWRHVPGVLNPADLPSRGCSPKQLFESKWWEGPEWLRQHVSTWPHENVEYDEEECLLEKRKKIVTSLVNSGTKLMNSEDWHLTYFSSFLKTIRMIAWLFRFLENIRHPKEKLCGELSLEEIDKAEVFAFKIVQAESFGNSGSEKLKPLDPYTDERGLIRLKSRVSARQDSELFRYPIVLPSKHSLVTKIIFDTHVRSCHIRTQGLLSLLRERFWIMGGRRSVRSVIARCVICKRHNGKSFGVGAPPLPLDRVREASAFEVTGVDFAGPVFLRSREKAWICLFTCAVFRAVHLELCTSLSVTNFLQSLRRFIARRGRPKTIFSDNGTNFVGTDNAFKLLDWDAIATYSSAERIKWRFNPPTASWWGGFWERLIGSLKQLLRKTLGRAALSYEELVTVLCDCEMVINSRPLTYLSSDPGELVPLTPMMFLREQQESGVPDCDALDSRALCKRVLYLQKIRRDLRQRFRTEYLGQLCSSKRGSSGRKIKMGDIVLIGNDNDKRMDWPLGLVTELLSAKDGEIRLVRLKTARGQVLRPVQRLYPLECVTTENLPVMPTDDPVEPGNHAGEASDCPLSVKDDVCAGSTGVAVKSRVPESLVKRVVTRSGRNINVPKRFL